MASKGIQRGLALVTVLWFIALISILALGFSKSTRTDVAIARNLLDGAQTRHLADAAIERAVMTLLDPQPEDEQAIMSGRSIPFNLGEAAVSYSIHSEQGKIDINQAPDMLLQGLLLAIGLQQEQATSVADAIIDWRDENDLRQLNGAERAEYQQARLGAGPSNAPFRSIAELQQVMGIDSELYRQLSPYVTVHSFIDQVNPQTAPKTVLLAIPGVNASEVEVLIAAREARDEGETVLGQLPVLTGVDEWTSNDTGNIYTIVATARLPSGASFSREVTVLVSADADLPYYLLDSRVASVDHSIGEQGE